MGDSLEKGRKLLQQKGLAMALILEFDGNRHPEPDLNSYPGRRNGARRGPVLP